MYFAKNRISEMDLAEKKKGGSTNPGGLVLY